MPPPRAAADAALPADSSAATEGSRAGGEAALKRPAGAAAEGLRTRRGTRNPETVALKKARRYASRHHTVPHCEEPELRRRQLHNLGLHVTDELNKEASAARKRRQKAESQARRRAAKLEQPQPAEEPPRPEPSGSCARVECAPVAKAPFQAVPPPAPVPKAALFAVPPCTAASKAALKERLTAVKARKQGRQKAVPIYIAHQPGASSSSAAASASSAPVLDPYSAGYSRAAASSAAPEKPRSHRLRAWTPTPAPERATSRRLRAWTPTPAPDRRHDDA